MMWSSKYWNCTITSTDRFSNPGTKSLVVDCTYRNSQREQLKIYTRADRKWVGSFSLDGNKELAVNLLKSTILYTISGNIPQTRQWASLGVCRTDYQNMRELHIDNVYQKWAFCRVNINHKKCINLWFYEIACKTIVKRIWFQEIIDFTRAESQCAEAIWLKYNTTKHKITHSESRKIVFSVHGTWNLLLTLWIHRRHMGMRACCHSLLQW